MATGDNDEDKGVAIGDGSGGIRGSIGSDRHSHDAMGTFTVGRVNGTRSLW